MHSDAWTAGIKVEERRLQEYLAKKDHSAVLRSAAESKSHTLAPTPTSICEDGCLHFGDSLMLRNEFTEGLLQADADDTVKVVDGSRSDVVGASLSTGTLVLNCPRTVFTISRAVDGLEDDPFVHYGQAIRIGSSSLLCDIAMYIHATASEGDGVGTVCAYPRATPRTHWRIVVPGAAEGSVVSLKGPLRFENIATAQYLRSDSTVHINSYGCEWRVFAEGAVPDAKESLWTFVDSRWAEEKVRVAQQQLREDMRRARDAATNASAGETRVVARAPVAQGSPDAGDLLRNPVALANHELRVLEREVQEADYAVLARVFPLLRSGMHVVRKTRRMCLVIDVERTGVLPSRTFEGILGNVGIRLKAEFQKLTNLFETEPQSSLVRYTRFFDLMGNPMPKVRETVVSDAYSKLEALATAGLVEVRDLQRNWNPMCHPDVQQGKIAEAEAVQDFFQQWDVCAADGTVSWAEFLDYYQDVSMAVESNEHFIELVRRGWRLDEAPSEGAWR